MNVLKGQFFKISAFQKSYTRIITSRVFFYYGFNKIPLLFEKNPSCIYIWTILHN